MIREDNWKVHHLFGLLEDIRKLRDRDWQCNFNQRKNESVDHPTPSLSLALKLALLYSGSSRSVSQSYVRQKNKILFRFTGDHL